MLFRHSWIVASIVIPFGCVATAARAAEPAPALERQPVSALPITARIKVPAGPAWLETGFGSLWVSKINSKEVLRIDPNTDAVIATIRVGSKPELGIGRILERSLASIRRPASSSPIFR